MPAPVAPAPKTTPPPPTPAAPPEGADAGTALPTVFLWKPTAEAGGKLIVEAGNIGYMPSADPKDPSWIAAADRSTLTIDAKTGAMLAGTARMMDPSKPEHRQELEAGVAALGKLGLTADQGNMDSSELLRRTYEDPQFLASVKPGSVVFAYQQGDPNTGQLQASTGYAGELAKAPQAVRDAVAAVESLGTTWTAAPLQPPPAGAAAASPPQA